MSRARASNLAGRHAICANYRDNVETEAERIAAKMWGRDKPTKRIGEAEVEKNQRERARITLRKF
jgi:hypothetical protein